MAPVRRATILHADLDAFYASVEQLLDPSLRGKPIAVGPGVVLAASYEAKAFGITAGMPGWRARKLCPTIRFADGHFPEYQRLGDEVIEVFRDFTPLVERISIDEAFLDVAGAIHLFGSPAEIGRAIRRRVRTEIGLAVSVGVAQTKHLAKIASQVAKPDGLVVVHPDREREFLNPLPIELIWGVGPATRALLAAKGIHTIGDIADVPTSALQLVLGQAAGSKIGSLAANSDPRRVETDRRASSVGAQSALGRQQATPSLIRSTFGYLADRVASRLRDAGRAGRTITVRVRFTELRSITRSATLPVGISSTLTIAGLATDLAIAAVSGPAGGREITLLAVSVSNLTDEPAWQLELPLGLGDDWRPGSPRGAALRAVDRSVDAVRARFGRDAVGYLTAMSSAHERVPDAFRELAEHHDPPR